MKGDFVFAVPGDLDTPTGGYAYDKRMIAELRELGWRPQVVNLGEGFPHPSALTRATAKAQLNDVPKGRAIVIDGLAFGVMPDEAEALSKTHPLIAMVHHPLALESGVTPEDAAALRESERKALSFTHAVIVNSRTTADALRRIRRPGGAHHGRAPGHRPRVPSCRAHHEGPVALLTVGSLVPRKGYDVLIEALATLIDLPWHLTIVGDARDPATAAQVRRRSSNITSSGRVLRCSVRLRPHVSPSFTPYPSCSCCRRATKASAWPTRKRSHTASP